MASGTVNSLVGLAEPALPSLTFGNLVVYASHGIGRVVARKERPATVVLEFAGGLSVTLPVERALTCVRPLASESEIAFVRTALQGTESVADAVWQKRLKATQKKVADGETVGLAEVVRDGAHRERRLAARGEGARFSVTERQLYQKARRLLAEEIGTVRGVESSEADLWIDDQLCHGFADTDG
jgi:RNA polymerase-interacting CarD/CdnL/TRCF family regulator